MSLDQHLDPGQVEEKRTDFEAARKNPEAKGGGRLCSGGGVMGAKERNEAAREIATENPGRVADHAAGSEWLRAALNAWPLPDLGGEMWHTDPERRSIGKTRRLRPNSPRNGGRWYAAIC